jgi:hypothetical protein
MTQVGVVANGAGRQRLDAGARVRVRVHGRGRTKRRHKVAKNQLGPICFIGIGLNWNLILGLTCLASYRIGN